MAAADLAAPPATSNRASAARVTITAGPPGNMPVHDAAMLSGGVLLVACAEAGVYLRGSDGRVRSRWDVPAHRLVMADHGGTVLLITRRESLSDLYRLDLATRRVRRYEVRLLCDGMAHGLARSGLAILNPPGHGFEVELPQASAAEIGLRFHGGISTVWDTSGRVVAADPHGKVVANLSVRIS